MSREIKFRAWNKTVKKFTHFGEGSPFLTITEINIGRVWGMFLMALDNTYLASYEEPQQYTGIKDKNDVEIYEGDIVKIPLFCIPEGQTAIKYVEFIDGKYVLKSKNDIPAWMYTLDSVFSKNTEVIGNIYENSELLESKCNINTEK